MNAGLTTEDFQAWRAGMPQEDKEFEDNLRALVALLDDPHPGLASWTCARINLARKIYAFLRERFDG